MTGGIRLSSPPAGHAGGGCRRSVSVRSGDEELRRVRALTVIFATTPNAVIREARSFFFFFFLLLLSHAAGAASCHQAAGACRRGASEVAGLYEQEQAR